MSSITKKDRAVRIIKILEQATKDMPQPASIQIVKEYGKDPFLILISCLLSLRARDTVTLPISRKLFAIASTPQQMMDVPSSKLERIIYSIGYYKNKAKQLKEVSRVLLERFGGKVPDTYEELTSIKSIGPKTANLVLGEAFDKQSLYVDIHVHRISNRLGLVETETAKATQAELEQLIPKQYWNAYSRLIVTWGQNVCVPISPFCSSCAIYKECKRVGVNKQR